MSSTLLLQESNRNRKDKMMKSTFGIEKTIVWPNGRKQVVEIAENLDENTVEQIMLALVESYRYEGWQIKFEFEPTLDAFTAIRSPKERSYVFEIITT